ncbi:hypothetical protein BpHYR1_030946 [Brachionus plicatilis]|uniref:Uncharacterized protein n=1 Tax=Brachionus plicatilis TaxID=10195 RepID=A0A3M7SVX1_BRAPC|nr:hypothetical protein BpHYR1_030946 [Brachionus plicatilis]
MIKLNAYMDNLGSFEENLLFTMDKEFSLILNQILLTIIFFMLFFNDHLISSKMVSLQTKNPIVQFKVKKVQLSMLHFFTKFRHHQPTVTLSAFLKFPEFSLRKPVFLCLLVPYYSQHTISSVVREGTKAFLNILSRSLGFKKSSKNSTDKQNFGIWAYSLRFDQLDRQNKNLIPNLSFQIRFSDYLFPHLNHLHFPLNQEESMDYSRIVRQFSLDYPTHFSNLLPYDLYLMSSPFNLLWASSMALGKLPVSNVLLFCPFHQYLSAYPSIIVIESPRSNSNLSASLKTHVGYR